MDHDSDLEDELEIGIPFPESDEEILDDDEEMQPGIVNTRFTHPLLLGRLCSYLHSKDLKNLRLVNGACNGIVIENPSFIEQHFGSFSTKWYSQARGTNRNNIIKWNNVKMNHFSYYRHVSLFKLYWQVIGNTITSLTMSNSSFECDGFAFILNHLPKLTNLVLSGIKLRDLDDYHNPLIMQMQNGVRAQPNECFERFTSPLKHLTLDNCNYIENCFYDYLIKRTGQLETMNLTSCFYETTKNPYVHRQTTRRRRRNNNAQIQNQDDVVELANVKPISDAIPIQKLKAIFEQFKYYFRQLLWKNATTLKKMTIANNNFTSEIYPIIIAIPTIQLQDLNINIEPENRVGLFGIDLIHVDNIPAVCNLITTNCRNGLEKFTLDLHDKQFNNEQLLQLLTPIILPNIKTLKICYNNTLIKDDSIIDLTTVMNQMVNLEFLEIQDKKVIAKKQYKAFLKPSTANKLSEDQKNGIWTAVESKINMKFLPNLPASIRQLRFDGIVTRDSYLLFPDHKEVERLQFANKLNLLTTLEIKGPWIHINIQETVTKIFSAMQGLTSLALVNCNLTDANLTGLTHEAARELRKSNLYMTPYYYGTTNNPYSALYRQPVVDETGVRKKTIAEMRNLRNLDLSQNRITNVTLAFSLSKIPGLKTLNLSSCRRINDMGLEVIGYEMKSLEELNVKHCHGISQIGLNAAIEKCKHLKRLYVTKRVSNASANFVNGLEEGGHLHFPLNQHFNEVISASDEEDPMKNDFEADDSSDEDEQEA